MPEKILYYNVKNNRLWKKISIFSFFVALIEIWPQHKIKRIILGIIPTFNVWIRPIWENKNITSSDCNYCFLTFFRLFGHFRLPELIETPTKPQFEPSSMPSKNFWALKKFLGKYRVWGGRDGAPRFFEWKKNSQLYKINKGFDHNEPRGNHL